MKVEFRDFKTRTNIVATRARYNQVGYENSLLAERIKKQYERCDLRKSDLSFASLEDQFNRNRVLYDKMKIFKNDPITDKPILHNFLVFNGGRYRASGSKYYSMSRGSSRQSTSKTSINKTADRSAVGDTEVSKRGSKKSILSSHSRKRSPMAADFDLKIGRADRINRPYASKECNRSARNSSSSVHLSKHFKEAKSNGQNNIQNHRIMRSFNADYYGLDDKRGVAGSKGKRGPQEFKHNFSGSQGSRGSLRRM
jgi:hypothetical protein